MSQHGEDSEIQPYFIEKNGAITGFNEAFLQLTGYHSSEIISKSSSNIYMDLLRIDMKLDKPLDKKNAILFTKDLVARFVSIQIKALESLHEFMHIFKEIPNMRFEQSNTHLMQLCKAEIIGVAVYSVPDMVLVQANQKYLNFLEAPFDQKRYSIGRKIHEIIPGWNNSPVIGYWEQAIQTKSAVVVTEYEHIGYKRGITYWESIITPILEDETVKFVVSNTYDITERVLCRKKAEEQREIIKQQQFHALLSEQEKNNALESSMKLKDEFLYLITHEFRTPIAVVNSALQAIDLICKEEITERLRKFLNTIKQNTNRQLRLVNNLLDISRLSSESIKLNMKVFDIIYITKAIVSSVELYAKQKKIHIHFKSRMQKKEMYLDEEKYERILLNLLANALKFTPEGKNVYISIFTKKHKDQNMLCIQVKDEGIGIPKDRQEIIFERFGQAETSLSKQAEGTGLGLHLVKLLVKAHAGEVLLKSAVGKGSTFNLLLPINSGHELNEANAVMEADRSILQDDSKLIQAVAIEFSDIYI